MPSPEGAGGLVGDSGKGSGEGDGSEGGGGGTAAGSAGASDVFVEVASEEAPVPVVAGGVVSDDVAVEVETTSKGELFVGLGAVPAVEVACTESSRYAEFDFVND